LLSMLGRMYGSIFILRGIGRFNFNLFPLS
jgi:hypothetical protein